MHIVTLSLSIVLYLYLIELVSVFIFAYLDDVSPVSPEDKNCINPKLLINPLAAGLKWGGQPVNIKPLPHLRDSCHFNFHLSFLAFLLSSASDFCHFYFHLLLIFGIFAFTTFSCIAFFFVALLHMSTDLTAADEWWHTLQSISQHKNVIFLHFRTFSQSCWKSFIRWSFAYHGQCFGGGQR